MCSGACKESRLGRARELIKHRVSLRTSLRPHLLEILGDRVQLHQVIINLLMNKIEAIEPVTDLSREL